MTGAAPRIALIGVGDAREFAFFFRLVEEGGPEAVRFALISCAEPVIDTPALVVADTPAAAVEVAAAFRPDVVLVLDPNLLFTDLPNWITAAGLTMFGPMGASIALERSKLFMKRALRAAAVPTPEWHVLSDAAPEIALAPIRDWFDTDGAVLKSDLFLVDANLRTAIPENFDEACAMLAAQRKVIRAEAGCDAPVFAERRIGGTELSVHVFWDGRDFWLCPPSLDFKRAHDGDTGPNTHGAAALAFGRGYATDFERRLRQSVLAPLLGYLVRAGLAYRGCLYLGAMIQPDGGIELLEINVRPGNPEIVALLALYEGRLGDALCAIAEGRLDQVQPVWRTDCVSAVVFAMAEGYPARAQPMPVPITALPAAGFDSQHLPQGIGRAGQENGMVVQGGRVSAAVAAGPTLDAALQAVFAIYGEVEFAGKHARTDLARHADTLGAIVVQGG